jgi:N6-L-threonylcarbamoyladenine synthase
MNVLGIETSCDETAVAVIETSERGGLRTLSNVISSQVALHAQFGGVVPALAAREHAANIGHVLASALAEAKVDLRDVDLISVTRGPGLGPALLVGLMFARTLAWRHSIPLVGVNHMDGHIHSNWLDRETDDAVFPALNLVVSGGHTELVLMHGHGAYEILGATRDDAVGEAFDKVARILELGYPGGPTVAKLAAQGNPAAFPLPRPMISSMDLDFSYSGLKTAVLYLVRDLTAAGGPLSESQRADIAASFQEAAIDVLIRKTESAARQTNARMLFLSGGVSANILLRERLTALGAALGIPVRIPLMTYTTDNAAMIAAAGFFSYQRAAADSWETVSMDANLQLGHNQS